MTTARFLVTAHQSLVISVKENMRTNVHVLEAMESVANNLPYLTVNKAAFSATLLNLPERTDIPVPVREQLIVEYYTRLT